MDLVLTKSVGEIFIPSDEETLEAMKKLKLGNPFKCLVTFFRNYKFHRKYFALLNYAFDIWEPELPTWRGHVIQKEREEFRNNITILAGHYKPVFDVFGNMRLRAKSIAFGNMSQEQFEDLYSRTVDVILKHILTNYKKQDLENVLNQLWSFT